MMYQSTSTPKEPLSKRIILFLIASILLFAPGCSLAEARVELCWRLSSGSGQILHSDPNPSGSYIIHVVTVDCGQSSTYGGKFYKCSTRLDLEITAVNDHRVIQGYELPGACDAKIKWLDDVNFETTWSNGNKEEMNISDNFAVLPSQ